MKFIDLAGIGHVNLFLWSRICGRSWKILMGIGALRRESMSVGACSSAHVLLRECEQDAICFVFINGTQALRLILCVCICIDLLMVLHLVKHDYNILQQSQVDIVAGGSRLTW